MHMGCVARIGTEAIYAPEAGTVRYPPWLGVGVGVGVGWAIYAPEAGTVRYPG